MAKTNKSAKTYTVYMHIVNGKKRYIGVTSQSVKARWRRGTGYENNQIFFQDIVKYGWDNIEHVIVAELHDKDDAYNLEERLIKRYDTCNQKNGYNMRFGGYNNHCIPLLGQHISEAKMGHEVTPETRAKLSEYWGIEVVCLTIEGEYVKTYPSMTAAAKEVGVHKTNIWAVCEGRKPTCRGYKWARAE